MQQIILFSLILISFLSLTSAENKISLNAALNDVQKTIILEMHNEFRNLVASGVVKAANKVLPTATNMNTLVWDTELETMAQKYINKDPAGHSGFRTMHSHPLDYVGENFFSFRKTSSDMIVPGEFNFRIPIESWSSEVKDYDGDLSSWNDQANTLLYRQFSQVVWAKTTRIGCGILDYVIKTPEKQYDQIVKFVCNYWLGGNMKHEAIYEAGRPDCGGKFNSKFNFLCA